MRKRSIGAGAISLAAGIALLLAAPFGAGAVLEAPDGSLVDDAVQEVEKRVTAPSTAPSAPAPSRTAQQQAAPEGYTAPLHGTNPHGQGTVAVIDLAPSTARPLAGDTAGGEADQQEEVVVGRSRAEENEGGSYRSHVTVVALFGNEIIGVDATEGQDVHGPLDAINQAIAPLCGGGDAICLTVLRADAKASDNSSESHFAVADATVGGNDGLTAKAAQSNATAEQDAASGCDRTHGDSQAAQVTAGGTVVADALTSSSSSDGCSGTTTTDGRVIGLGNQGVPLPAPECGAGEPTKIEIPLLLTIICNAVDVNGAQTGPQYSVREALTLLGVNAGGSSLAKVTATSAESVARASGGGTPPPPPPTGDGDPDGGGVAGEQRRPGARGDRPGRGGSAPSQTVPLNTGDAADREARGPAECADGIDNDGDGKVDFPNDPQCESRADNSEADARLPFTGTNALLILMLGLVTTAAGFTLHGRVASWAPRR